MRTASRQSSSKYLIKRGEKPTQIQNEDGESGNLFWHCETLLLLFSCKILLNQFTHFRGYPVPIELKQRIPSLNQMSPGLEDVSAVPQTAQQQLCIQGATQEQGTAAGVSRVLVVQVNENRTGDCSPVERN